MDAIAEIKRLYYAATKATIQQDLYRAIDLLKTLPSEDDREKVAVYMDGLAQMRSEWSASARHNAGVPASPHSPGSSRSSSGPRGGAPRGRSDRSRASSRRS
jgi:hypothetical protein